MRGRVQTLRSFFSVVAIHRGVDNVPFVSDEFIARCTHASTTQLSLSIASLGWLAARVVHVVFWGASFPPGT